MTLPANPTLQGVNTELGRTSTLAFDMNSDALVRTLAQVAASGPWSMSSLAGKSSANNSLFVGLAADGLTRGFQGAVFGSQACGAMSPAVLNGRPIVQLSGYPPNTFSLGIQGNVADAFWYALAFKTSANAAPFLQVLRSTRSNFSVGVGQDGQTYSTWQFLNPVPGLDWVALAGQTLSVNIMY